MKSIKEQVEYLRDFVVDAKLWKSYRMNSGFRSGGHVVSHNNRPSASPHFDYVIEIKEQVEYLRDFVVDEKNALFDRLIQERTDYVTVVLEDLFLILSRRKKPFSLFPNRYRRQKYRWHGES